MAKDKDKIEYFAYLKMVDGQKKLMDKLVSAVGESKANQMYDQIVAKISDETDIKAEDIDSFVTQLAENNNATKKLVNDVFVSIKNVEDAKKKVDKNYVDTQNAVNNAKNSLKQKREKLSTVSNEEKKNILKQISTDEKQLKQLKIEDFINSSGVLTVVPDEVLVKYFKNGYLEFPKNINISNIQGLFEDGSKLKTDLVGVNNIPSNLRVIGKNIFNGCSNLRNFDVPVTVTTIEDGAFAHCSSLQTLNLPSTLINVGDMAFAGTTCQLTIDDNNGKYKLVNGQFIDIQTKTLVAYDEMQSRDFVPDKNINIIGQAAFMGVILNSIAIKDSNIKIIDKVAFKDAIIDNNVTINNVEAIKDNAFENAKVGGNVEISADTIEQNAFEKADIGKNLIIEAEKIEKNAVKDAVINGDLKVKVDQLSTNALADADVKNDVIISADEIDTNALINTQCNNANIIAKRVNNGALRDLDAKNVVNLTAEEVGDGVLEGSSAKCAVFDVGKCGIDMFSGAKLELVALTKRTLEGIRTKMTEEIKREVSYEEIYTAIQERYKDMHELVIFEELLQQQDDQQSLQNALKEIKKVSEKNKSIDIKNIELTLENENKRFDQNFDSKISEVVEDIKDNINESPNPTALQIEKIYQTTVINFQTGESFSSEVNEDSFNQFAQTWDTTGLIKKEEEKQTQEENQVAAYLVIEPQKNK